MWIFLGICYLICGSLLGLIAVSMMNAGIRRSGFYNLGVFVLHLTLWPFVLIAATLMDEE